MFDDLREFLKKAEELGQVNTIEGADWNLEIGRIVGPPGQIGENCEGYTNHNDQTRGQSVQAVSQVDSVAESHKNEHGKGDVQIGQIRNGGLGKGHVQQCSMLVSEIEQQQYNTQRDNRLSGELESRP